MRVLFSVGVVAISKPRCGSTSVRRMLDPFVNKDEGDISINLAGEAPPFHPHISAPYLRELIQEMAPEARLEYFVTVRHPIELLESYYKYFEPDSSCRYNFDPRWQGKTGMDFEHWVLHGRLGMNDNWKRLGPDFISDRDLSPLSLEACAMNVDGSWAVDHIFRLEEMDRLAHWLSEKVGTEISPKHVNQSRDYTVPALGIEALEKIRKMMPYECDLYGI